LSLKLKEKLFQDMSRELLSNMGFHIVKEEHEIKTGKKIADIKMCVDFKSKQFQSPKYAPNGVSFVECLSLGKSCAKSISALKDSIGTANKDPNYLRRLHGKKIEGGVILVNESGKNISEKMIQDSNKQNFYIWDIHRVFFYCMKVFSHSILENWVSQSPLGIVFNEKQIPEQFEPKHYHTSSMSAIRYSENADDIEVYFTYFVDCLRDPRNISAHDDSLHTENVKHILDDAYNQMKEISSKFYPNIKKNVTIEIHSLAGFTEDAEYKVKLYSKNHHDWKTVGLNTYPTIDEHTLFKYSIIPWEAVMDYAFTKKTGTHTHAKSEITTVLHRIEDNFTKEFRDGISNSQIIDPFTGKTFLERKIESFAAYPTLLSAHVTRSPIKQRLLIFSRIALKGERVDELEKIIAEILTSPGYNYHWIGLMSGSGFSPEMIDYAVNFDKQGVGLGLIDAVTKRLIVNKKTEEGKHLNQMFLSECIS
jgi:hypothetical protein